MKRPVLIATSLLLVFPDIAVAQMHTQPVRPGPGQPGGPAVQPPRPGNGVRPPRPRPPVARPPRPRPPIKPPVVVRPPRPRPPHRPGYRPPNFRPLPGPVFHYPRGWRYRRWVVGVLLPSIFLGSTYQYTNFAALGIGPPPSGYRWVRYGPDLLLVNIRTRKVADVIYGAFT